MTMREKYEQDQPPAIEDMHDHMSELQHAISGIPDERVVEWMAAIMIMVTSGLKQGHITPLLGRPLNRMITPIWEAVERISHCECDGCKRRKARWEGMDDEDIRH